MNDFTNNEKINRVLSIYTKLTKGVIIDKAEEAIYFHVSERTIQRDIDDIRKYMDLQGAEKGVINTVIYNREKRGFCLEQNSQLKLTNPEILAICKILLDSRAFTKSDMSSMLNKMIDNCVPLENQRTIKKLISNEEFHYIEPRHKKNFIGIMWEIGQAICSNHYIEIDYQGLQGGLKTRKIKPAAIIFSEMYFYMAAFHEDKDIIEHFNVMNDAFPTIYRIDRIQRLKTLEEQFYVPYANRFEEGEYRKRIQFMYGGKLRRVRFRYSGYSVEAVLDRLPTAKIESEEDGKYVILAEVFGDGIDMWLRSQGEAVELI